MGIAVHRVYDIARMSPAIAHFKELWLYVLCETVSHQETGLIELDKCEFQASLKLLRKASANHMIEVKVYCSTFLLSHLIVCDIW